WDGDPRPKPQAELEPRAASLLADIQAGLEDEAVQATYSNAGRDLESLGLAYGSLDPTKQLQAPSALDREQFSTVVLGSLRILGQMRRFPRLRWGVQNPPRTLRLYWEAVAARHGVDPELIADAVLAACGSAVTEFLIERDQLFLVPGSDSVWLCES